MEYSEYLFTGVGKRHFILSENDISVSRRRCNLTLLLKGLQPDYRTGWQRTPAFGAGLFFLFFGPIIAYSSLISGSASSYSLTDIIKWLDSGGGEAFIFCLATLLTPVGLLLAFGTRRKVEHAIFKNTTGIDALSIAKAGPDSSTFEHFVNEIARRVRHARSVEGPPQL
jgi:hypothetical protein